MIRGPMHELTRIEPATIEDLPSLAELLMDRVTEAMLRKRGLV